MGRHVWSWIHLSMDVCTRCLASRTRRVGYYEYSRHGRLTIGGRMPGCDR